MELRVDTLEDIFPLADFIADAFGETAEVVVHDASNTESSLVYIRHSKLSGRKLGNGMNDLVISLVYEGSHSDRPFVANYTGKSMLGNSFRCSTYFVKNRKGKLIGLLCVNICITGISEAMRILTMFQADPAHIEERESEYTRLSIEDTLQGNPKETIRSIARRTIKSTIMNPDWITRSERLEVLRKISGEGVFLMKGAVPVVADELGVSVPTLYKYLQEIREDEPLDVKKGRS